MKKVLIIIITLFFASNLIAQDEPHILKVRAWWTENGNSTYDDFYPDGEYDINYDEGTQIDIRVYKSSYAPSSCDFCCSCWGGGTNECIESLNSYVQFNDVITPLTNAIWCYVDSPDGYIRLYPIPISSGLPDLVPVYLEVDGHLYPEGIEFNVGQEVDLDCWHMNAGSAPTTTNCRIGFYISSTPGDPDKYIDYNNTGILGPNELEEEHETYTFESSDIGERYVVFYADYQDAIEEGAAESNNIESWGPFIVNESVSITINEPSSDLSILQGDEVNISWSGNAPDGSYVQLRFDQDNIFGNDNDVVIGDQGISGSFPWNTSSVIPGPYYILGVLYYNGTYMYDYAPGIVTIEEIPTAHIQKVRAYWTENGISTSADFQPYGEYNINYDQGTQIDVRIYKSSYAPSSCEFCCSCWGGGTNECIESPDSYVQFNDVITPLTNAIWCYVDSPDGYIRLYPIPISSGLPDLVPVYLEVDGHLYPEGIEFNVGQEVDLDCWHMNAGSTPTTTNCRIGFYISSTPGDPDKYIDYNNTGILGPNALEEEHETYTFESSDIGERYVVFYADYQDAIEEGAAESNNIESWGPFIVNESVSITINEPSSDLSILQGDEVNISWSGNAPDGSYVQLRFDQDNIFGNDNDVVIGDQGISGSFPWNTSSVIPGPYYILGVLYYNGTYMYDYAPGIVTIEEIPTAHIQKVRAYWTENGISTSADFQPYGEYNINYDQGTPIDVRIYKSSYAPSSCEFCCSCWGGGTNECIESPDSYVQFNNVITPLTNAIWCYIDSPDGYIRLYPIPISSGLPDLVPVYLEVDGHLYPEGIEFNVGQQVDLDCWHMNAGSAPTTTDCRIGFYISSTPGDPDKYIDYNNTGILGPNALEEEHETYTFESSDIGERYVVFYADYQDAIEEGAAESNNIESWGPFAVTDPNTYTVSGTARSNLNNYDKIQGAYVTIVANGITLNGVTDLNGNYSIPNVPGGNHTIAISHSDYNWDNYSPALFVTGNTVKNFSGSCKAVIEVVAPTNGTFTAGNQLIFQVKVKNNSSNNLANVPVYLDVSLSYFTSVTSQVTTQDVIGFSSTPQIIQAGSTEMFCTDINTGITTPCTAAHMLITAYNANGIGPYSERSFKVKINNMPDVADFIVRVKGSIGDKRDPNSGVQGQQGLYEKEIHFNQTGTFSLSGKAKSSINNFDVVPGATIQVSGNPTLSTVTDANGNYYIPGITNGPHSVTISHPSYTFTEASVDINSQQNLTRDFLGNCNAELIITTVDLPSTFTPNVPLSITVHITNNSNSDVTVPMYLDISFPNLTSPLSDIIVNNIWFNQGVQIYQPNNMDLIWSVDQTTGIWTQIHPQYVLVSGCRTLTISHGFTYNYTVTFTPPDINNLLINIKGNIGDKHFPTSGIIGQQGLHEIQISLQNNNGLTVPSEWGTAITSNVLLFNKTYQIREYQNSKYVLIYEIQNNLEILIQDQNLADAVILYHFTKNTFWGLGIDNYLFRINNEIDFYDDMRKKFNFKTSRIRIGNAAFTLAEVVAKLSVGILDYSLVLPFVDYINNNFLFDYNIQDFNSMKNLSIALTYLGGGNGYDQLINYNQSYDLAMDVNKIFFKSAKGIDWLDKIKTARSAIQTATTETQRGEAIIKLSNKISQVGVSIGIDFIKLAFQNAILPDVSEEALKYTTTGSLHCQAILGIDQRIAEKLEKIETLTQSTEDKCITLSSLIHEFIKTDILIRRPLRWELYRSQAFHMNNIRNNAVIGIREYMGATLNNYNFLLNRAEEELGDSRINDFAELYCDNYVLCDAWRYSIGIINNNLKNDLDFDKPNSNMPNCKYGETQTFNLKFKNLGLNVLSNISFSNEGTDNLYANFSGIPFQVPPLSDFTVNYTINIPEFINDRKNAISRTNLIRVEWNEGQELFSQIIPIEFNINSDFHEITIESDKELITVGENIQFEANINAEAYIKFKPTLVLEEFPSYEIPLNIFIDQNNLTFSWTPSISGTPKASYAIKLECFDANNNKILDDLFFNHSVTVLPIIEGDISNFDFNAVHIITSQNPSDAEISQRLSEFMPNSDITYTEGLSAGELLELMQQDNLLLIGGHMANPLVDFLVQQNLISEDTWTEPGDDNVYVFNDAFQSIAPPGNKTIVVAGYSEIDTYCAGTKLLITMLSEENIVATPEFNPPPPFYFNTSQTVSLSSLTPGAIIHYTMDGDDPDENSPIYTSPINLTETTELKAKAYKSDMVSSQIAEGEFTLNQLFFTISGIITTSDGSPLSNITVQLNGEYNSAATTNEDGYYIFYQIPQYATFSIHISNSQYTFNPPFYEIIDLGSHQTKDFIALEPSLLAWSNTAGYNNSGVNPDNGDNQTCFTFKCRYLDPNDNPPSSGYPKLYVWKGLTQISGSPFILSTIDFNPFTEGRNYEFSLCNLEVGNDYSFYFEAMDLNGHFVQGDPTSNQTNLTVTPFAQPLIPDFSTYQTPLSNPPQVNFFDQTIGNSTGWAWDFENDGIFDAFESNPIHIFSSPGDYDVKLQVNNNNFTSTIIKTVSVIEFPQFIEFTNPGFINGFPDCSFAAVNSDFNFTWNFYNIENIKIEYSTDDVTWESIIESFQASEQSYLWPVPSNLTDSYLHVRISDASDGLPFTDGFLSTYNSVQQTNEGVLIFYCAPDYYCGWALSQPLIKIGVPGMPNNFLIFDPTINPNNYNNQMVVVSGYTIITCYVGIAGNPIPVPALYVTSIQIPPPELSIDLPQAITTCDEVPVQINSFINGGTQPYSFNWSPTTGLSSHTIQDPIASPSQTTTYYLTVTDGSGTIATDSVTVYVTSGGWENQASGFATPNRGISCISAVDENITWATAYDGTFTNEIIEVTKTENGGQTWNSVTVNDHPGYGPSMIFALNDNAAWIPIYGPNGNGKILKTIDGGQTWNTTPPNMFSGSNGFPNVVYFWDNEHGICIGNPNVENFEIYTTEDGGTSWIMVPSLNIPLPLTDETGVSDFYSVKGDTVFFGTSKLRIFRSVDKGLHWEAFNTPVMGMQYHFLSSIGFKNHLEGFISVIHNSGGVTKFLKTNNGGDSWQLLTSTGNRYFWDVGYIPGTEGTLIGTGSTCTSIYFCGAAYSHDWGETWSLFEDYEGIQMQANDFISPNCGWAGGYNSSPTSGGMFKFTGFCNPPQSKTITVRSENPDNGVSILVSPPDNTGQSSGLTEFSRSYNINTTVSLHAPGSIGNQNFVHWKKNSLIHSTDSVINFTVTDNDTLTAVYQTCTTFTLDIFSQNPSTGRTITITPNDIEGQGTTTTPFTRLYCENTAVSLTAPVVMGAPAFKHWLQNNIIHSTDNIITIEVDENDTFTAVYNALYEVKFQSENPTTGVPVMVTQDFYGLPGANTSFTRYFIEMSEITLSAPLTHGTKTFLHWKKNNVIVPGGNVLQETITGNTTYTAVYGLLLTITVSSLNPESGVTIAVSPPDINNESNGPTQFTRTYPGGVKCTLVAPPTSSEGNFLRWTKNNNFFSYDDTIKPVVIGNDVFTAEYQPCQLPAIHSVTGGGTYCSGGTGVNVGVNSTQVGATYQLKINGVANGLPKAGTGLAISWGAQTIEGIYTVEATNSCGSVNMNGSVAVSALPLPDQAGMINGPLVVTKGQLSVPYSVTLINNTSSYIWEYTGSGITINGEGNSIQISFSENATSGILTVTGINDCGAGQTSPDFSIIVNDPIIYNTTVALPDLTFCPGTIHMPIVLTNVNNLASLSLRIIFDMNTLTYDTIVNVLPALNGMLFFGGSNNVTLSWFSVNPVNIGNDTLAELVFLAIEGSSTISFDTLSGQYCLLTGGNEEMIPTLFLSGTLSVNTCNNISGVLKVDNASGTPMDNSQVLLKQNDMVVIQTGTSQDGSYLLSNVPNGNYLLTATSAKDWCVANSYDALLIQKDFIGMPPPLTGLRKQVADVSCNGFSNSYDALLVQKRFVGMIESFACGNWGFESINISMNNANITQEIKALSMGDVNGSCAPQVKLENSVSLSYYSSVDIIDGKLTLPVRAGSQLRFNAIDLALDFTDNCFEVTGVDTKHSGSLVYHISGNRLLISWYNIDPVIVASGEDIFNITLLISDPVKCKYPFSLGDESRFFEGNGNQLSNVLINTPVLNYESPDFWVRQNVPNPFNGITEVTFSLPQQAYVSVYISNILGETIKTLPAGLQREGQHTISVDLQGFSPGVYYYTLVASGNQRNDRQTRKLVISLKE
ncbi:MAG: carboxypeptidase regulatory-like domain-containing protein [Bacteroidales bacterium]